MDTGQTAVEHQHLVVIHLHTRWLEHPCVSKIISYGVHCKKTHPTTPWHCAILHTQNGAKRFCGMCPQSILESSIWYTLGKITN